MALAIYQDIIYYQYEKLPMQSDWRHQIPMHSLPIPAHRQYPFDKDRGKTVQRIAVINLLLHRIHICVHEKPLIRNIIL